MNLVRTSVLNGIAVAIRLGTGLLLNKILAIYVGPGGYTVIGQFQNVLAMLQTFASGGINTGVTKYTAEYTGDEQRQISVSRTAGTITVLGSGLAAVILALLREPLAKALLHDINLAPIFLWLAASLSLFSFNGLLIAILNGRKDINRFIAANIVGAILGLLVTGLFVVAWGLYGALVSLCLNQAAIFVVTIVICWRTLWFRASTLFGSIDLDVAKRLGQFALMAVTSALVTPLAQIAVRSYAIDTYWNTYAGFWEATQRISATYLSLATTTLSIYYLPRISELLNPSALKAELKAGYKLILPIVIIAALTLYVFRDLIITTLFASTFMPMQELFAWQLLGDVVKVASWMLAYVMVGKAMTSWFIITEIYFGLQYCGLTVAMSHWFGFQGLTIGYAANYLIYLAAMYALIVCKYLRDNEVKTS